MSEHLTDHQIALYCQNALPSQEWFVAGEHLAICDECRRRTRDHGEPRAVQTLAGDLTAALEDDAAHLDYDDMAAYIDGKADEILREIVEVHIQTCRACAEAIRELSAFRAMLSTYPVIRYEPAVEKTSLASASRTAQRLPGSVSAWVEQLLQSGMAAPVRAMQATLVRIDRALATMAPVPVRSAHSPRNLRPTFTAIRSLRPDLSWTAADKAEDYVVSVYESIDSKRGHAMRQVWSGSVGKVTQWTVPVGTSLEPGKVYVWQVIALRGVLEHPSVPAGFAIVTEAARNTVTALEQELSDAPLVLVGLYEAHGLYEEALRQVEKLNRLNTDSEIARNLEDKLRDKLHLPLM